MRMVTDARSCRDRQLGSHATPTRSAISLKRRCDRSPSSRGSPAPATVRVPASARGRPRRDSQPLLRLDPSPRRSARMRKVRHAPSRRLAFKLGDECGSPRATWPLRRKARDQGLRPPSDYRQTVRRPFAATGWLRRPARTRHDTGRRNRAAAQKCGSSSSTSLHSSIAVLCWRSR